MLPQPTAGRALTHTARAEQGKKMPLSSKEGLKKQSPREILVVKQPLLCQKES